MAEGKVLLQYRNQGSCTGMERENILITKRRLPLLQCRRSWWHSLPCRRTLLEL